MPKKNLAEVSCATNPKRLVAAFAMKLEAVKGFARHALEDDEVMGELAARGIKRAQVARLAETADDVGQGFFNDPVPA